MANLTSREALQIHGTNPQFLVEKIVRARIYDSPYWKEHCFALTAESIIDKAVELQYIGGMHGLQRPSPFLCLLQKLLQLQPEKEIVLEYLYAQEFKYLRALAAMYIRFTFRPVEVYEYLEPLLNDYRKLRWRDAGGNYSITFIDSFVDSLLQEERVCDIILPRLARRDVMEEMEGLPPRISKLEEALFHGNIGDRGDETRSDISDDSAAEERRERKRRIQRAVQIRDQRQVGLTTEGKTQQETEYDSQEMSEDDEKKRFISKSPSRGSVSPDRIEANHRYVSKSPSRSLSPDRQRKSRSRSISAIESHPSPPSLPPSLLQKDDASWKSRSPSRSPDRQTSPSTQQKRYMSKSPSRSPDRQLQ